MSLVRSCKYLICPTSYILPHIQKDMLFSVFA
nr:MAG TPA: hypothetical protein [Caudoviricetes sp.]